MTIRSKIDAIRRKAMLVALLAWLWCAGAMAAVAVDGWFGLLFIPGFLAFAGAVLFLLLGVRCPRCRGPLGHAVAGFSGSVWRISKRFRFCPFCGVELDSELDEPQAGDEVRGA